MKLNDFDYQLPAELIAHYPTKQRSSSRLLCLQRDTGQLTHRNFQAITELLNPGDCLVLNNSKVIPARVFGEKTSGGKLELLIERLLPNNQILAHLRVSKKPKPGDEIILSDGSRAKLIARGEELWRIQCLFDTPILQWLDKHGHIPLPPYIDRPDETIDQERYQTVFAEYNGSAAAPTAGLHFSDALLHTLRDKGVQIAFVTLHVGAGTFQPVRTENIADHVMHKEYVDVPLATCEVIKKTKAQGQRVIAGGTTTVRSLETASLSGEVKPYQGETDIFIYPGFQFNCIDGLLTNFHLPKSSLLMLVSAFAGLESIQHAYRVAITEKYRFFSYGDAMLII